LDENLFNAKNTRLQVAVDHWEDAVRLGGELLVAQGCVDESYIDGLLRNVREKREDIVLVDGIVIPYTRFEDGAFRLGVSFVTLKQPLSFAGSKEKIKLVLCFSPMSVQDYWHVASLAMDLIEYGVVKRLGEVTTIEEVKTVLALC
jgi:Mannitol/fructose-specific phosphotransferase system, IIA domain